MGTGKDSTTRKPINWVILLLLAVLFLSRPSRGGEPTLEARLRPYVQNGGIVVAHEDEVLYSYRAQNLFCPASTLKLATALMALYNLGETFRFKTEFYINGEGDLILRGYGDPFLISEEWEIIVTKLREIRSLPRELRDLRLDPSSFSPDLRIPGLSHSVNAYDAANGALVVNFNTAYVKVGNKGEIATAEAMTPLTPLVRRMAGGLPAGRHRINMSKDAAASLTYAGELARIFLAKGGFTFSGKTGAGSVGPEDRLIYTHRNTRSLREVIASMMLYSNNYIANQLLLTVGLEKRGEPATLEKGLAYLRSFLSIELGLNASDFQVVEGSGISRQNRITPRALLTVLRAFYPYRDLLPRGEGGAALVKTGTLRGVYSLGCYVEAKPPLFLAVILNQKNNSRGKILDLVREAYR